MILKRPAGPVTTPGTGGRPSRIARTSKATTLTRSRVAAKKAVKPKSDKPARNPSAKSAAATGVAGRATRIRTPGDGRAPRRAAPASGKALIARVSRAIERELTQIETILDGDTARRPLRTEAERRARTLASLARTLGEVMRLRAGDRKKKSEDDDAIPRDLTALRLELARRLDRLVADATAAHPDAAE